MPGLCDLPDEIILLSLNSGPLHRPADFAALALSCKRLKDVAEDALYTRNRDRDASSAVRWAAEHGNTATLEKALKHGLVIGDEDLSSELCSPFQTAVAHGQDSAVTWFLDHGVDITQQVRPRCEHRIEQTCILHVALCRGHASTAELLISRGVPLEYMYTEIGFPPFEMSALHEASRYGLDTVVEVLVKVCGMNPRTGCGSLDYDALCQAATFDDNVSTIRTLVRLGADVNGIEKEWESSPLHVALYEGNFAVAHTLLDLGARIRPDEHNADVDLNNEGTVEEETTDSEITSMESETMLVKPQPLQDAIESAAGRREAPRRRVPDPGLYKREQREKWRADRASFIKRLIELGVDVNMKSVVSSYGHNPEIVTPMDSANRAGKVEDMEILVTAGAKVRSKMLDDAWEIHDMSAKESISKIRFLLKHGARLDEPVRDGQSMLQVAAAHAESALEASSLHELLLLSSPKSLSPEHLNGVLAQYLARLDGHVSTVLVRHGARVSSGDELFLIISVAADEVEFETGINALQDIVEDEWYRWSKPGTNTCMGLIIDMGLSSEDQCLIFQDMLQKRQVALVHLFLDRGFARKPEAAKYLPAYLMVAAAWGDICVIKRLWQHLREDPYPALHLAIVLRSIIPGNREATSYFMEQGAGPLQHITLEQFHEEFRVFQNATTAELAALISLKDIMALGQDGSSAYLCAKREFLSAHILAHRFGKSEYLDTYWRPLLSPLQLAVRCGHTDIVRDLLERVTPSTEDANTNCDKIYIPCVLEEANEIRVMIEKAGLKCE